ncbi:hypothetical protein [Flavobacterium sp. SORGH_AS_0622]|uniref:hypothetical protein n=1 Tax=Flavobacterium sp. SORGH_AS_0622 TaxID=3041772 RepID=UPI002783D269|nr:hypothetical protein [Flavobacterium sp. SORGH_AS_0622]MDQ1165887.1 hypothetical protein [Flavobacterium sp. SORGH_AS_0622]
MDDEIKVLKDYLKDISSAIEATKKYQPAWVAENLKANLNPKFRFGTDGRAELVFGIDEPFELELNFKDSGKHHKRHILQALQSKLDKKSQELKELRRRPKPSDSDPQGTI